MNMMTMPVAMAMTVTKVALIIMINADSGDAGGEQTAQAGGLGGGGVHGDSCGGADAHLGGVEEIDAHREGGIERNLE